jgi:crotonobetainyl-CoA:carnitine CoA-transferase CaiB-like acyl-CoA transferase
VDKRPLGRSLARSFGLASHWEANRTPKKEQRVEYRNDLIEDPSRAFSAPLQTATWLARLDGYDAVGVRFRMPRDVPREQQTRGYFVPWSAIFYLEVVEN